MKVTKRDIMMIEPGSSVTFPMGDYKRCIAAQKYAYELAKTDPREGVERYATSIDNEKNSITITAIPK